MANLTNFPRIFEEEDPNNKNIDDAVFEELGKVDLSLTSDITLVAYKVKDDLYGVYCLVKKGEDTVDVGGLRLRQPYGEEGVTTAMTGISGTIEKLLKLPLSAGYIYIDLTTPDGPRH